jgi:deoxyribonuclease V
MVRNDMPNFITSLDVHYKPNRARAAAIAFDQWQAVAPTEHHAVIVNNIAPYIPGQFYKRELPCLLAAIAALSRQPDFLLIDGYVTLDAHNRPGLGAHLFAHFHNAIPVIGIAKTQFQSAPAFPITRGSSQSPLYITTAGIDAQTTANHIQQMHGPHRLPTLLKLTDHLARTGNL